MKAAVIFQKGEMPKYTEDFPEPIVNNNSEILISVKAVAIKHVDKSRASNKHYSTKDQVFQAKVIGGDCVGLLADGTRVYALGVSGTMAQRATIQKNTLIKIPPTLDNIAAAALPNAVAGSSMALRFKAGMKAGETVLINGATGFTGNIAVQIAKHYGAKKIIVTGRNQKTLQSLLDLGADEIISTTQKEEDFIAQLREIHDSNPFDIILDYLGGHTAEMILKALEGKGAFTHRTRFISIGSLTGDKIQLSSETLRSVDLQISGSGLGSWTKEEMQTLITEIIPEMFQLAAHKKLITETQTVELKEIETLWDAEVAGGKRLVVIL